MTAQALLHLCRDHFDAYATVVKGNVALATEFDAADAQTCGVCGVGCCAGGYFTVHRQHYVAHMGDVAAQPQPEGTVVMEDGETRQPDAVDPTAEAGKPRLVHESEELRIVLSGPLFVCEVPRRDAMGGISWDTSSTCDVEGNGVDSRCCRAILRLHEEVAELQPF